MNEPEKSVLRGISMKPVLWVRIKEAAKRRGTSVSEYIRSACLVQLEKEAVLMVTAPAPKPAPVATGVTSNE
jgi:hypothetical protein